MRRGTTLDLPIKVDIDISEMTVYVTFCQNGKTILEKSTIENDIAFEDEYLYVSLTQQDTLSFNQKSKVLDVEIQIRAIDDTGNAYVSNVMTDKVEKVLKDGVIEYANDWSGGEK